MFSIASAPAKQSVSETISVLSGRLSSATLLEDRRAAILGLRSFAKEYPASVASGALRSLIGSLSKDGEDIDTVKVVLETLLWLFSPNEDSPEASEEIALWLADEFTQRQENITLLLDFLDTNEFYSRLYSLKLLSAILSARTERTEECVFNARLGISRLVAILDDQRDAVRNEGITLLTYLTPTSIEIQKLVAFESAFDRVFNIIEADGGLTEGGRVVEDCLILLANLLRLNSSNQTLFRETGCIPRLSKLLKTAYAPTENGDEVASWAQAQKNRNIYALLAVIRLFLVDGAVGTAQNQSAFFHHGLLFHALQLAFSHDAEIPIKSEALVACADIIRGNASLQENFAQLQVPSLLEVPEEPVQAKANDPPTVYVIDGLLDLCLSVSSLLMFDLRRAACECLEAYFHNHLEVRSHFLRRAIEGHKSGADETANVLTTLLSAPTDAAAADPYRYWFAAVLLLHLIYDNPATKAMAMAVTEGDEANGEEVVTSIQTITAHLLSSLSRGDDSRVIIGILMLLLSWLFEDLDAVNDFLGEGSNVQGLIRGAVQNPHGDPLVQGLCVMLLGVVYEFSTKDSPIPRATLQTILANGLSRDRYIEKLSALRSHPFIRDFEVLPQKLDLSTGQKLPDVFFDATFVDFFKDNYSRILRAIDREPGLEISVVTNGVQKGISREMVDSLRAQVAEKDRALQDAQAELSNLSQQLGQEQADHRRAAESAALEVSRVKSVNEALHRNHDQELKKLQSDYNNNTSTLQQKHSIEVRRLQQQREEDLRKLQQQQGEEFRKLQQQQGEELRKRDAELARLQQQHKEELRKQQQEALQKDTEMTKQIESIRRTAQSEAEGNQRRAEAERADLKATISRLEVDLQKAQKTKMQELENLRKEHQISLASQTQLTKQAEAREAEVRQNLEQSEARCRELEERLRTADEEIGKLETQLKEKEEERQTVQSELDDLLMVFSDLEDKAKEQKARLRALGEEVSDAEDDDEEDADENEDGEPNFDGDEAHEGEEDTTDVEHEVTEAKDGLNGTEEIAAKETQEDNSKEEVGEDVEANAKEDVHEDEVEEELPNDVGETVKKEGNKKKKKKGKK